MKLLAFLSVFIFNTVSSQYQGFQDRRERYCTYGDNMYRHGQVVTLPRSPCATFRCDYNTLRLITQECVDRKGQCKRVGERWTESCVSYICQTKKRNNRQEYQAVISNMLCTDSNEQCRQPGTRFPFRIGSRVYRSCTCRTWLDNLTQKIKYFC
ncbi:hypothetical protein LOTGIDRAFT_230686 [Lottia gigantea]|uniref:Uncharacterized protein n=1 Tax=Lottia gigantea TaxID=225164 RepID=V4B5R2_LOTGI|nr:hypothetical protein LOTGIDRAFT_230686 [Lottia gigantea]ESP01402.1 hypothetical protein LOTGIDRAFT_230686 [Lottia gigantea]